MKRFSKEKRQQLVLTALITATVLFGVWYGLIRAQLGSIQALKSRCKQAETKLAEVRNTVARAEQIREDLEVSSKVLTEIEEKMASGDLYAWAITSIREFKAPYKLDIPQFSQIDGPRDSNMLPDFPYKQASLTVAGTGNYHEIGTFIADLENKNPFTRVCNLVLEPAPAGSGTDPEKLQFRMEIVALVKPTT
jgi:Tfp pilus assembly protein PilO